MKLSQKEFINEIRYLAIQAERLWYIPAELIIAVAIHETGYGTSENARINRNLFGITAKSKLDQVEMRDTTEFEDGAFEDRRRAFRSYRTRADSITDFCYRISHHYLYAPAYAALKIYMQDRDNKNLHCAIRMINMNDKGTLWATDPKWYVKVIDHIEKNELNLVRK